MDPLNGTPTNEELQGVKNVVSSFLIGLKNSTLYTENHNICIRSLEKAAKHLEDFLRSYGGLRLDVTKDQLLYKGETVSQESSTGKGFATVFFRDGIQWLEFLDGFDFNELREFFRILKGYGSQNEDSDGDLATAFWEANFPYFRYKAEDVYWESEPLLDYSQLKPGDDEEHVEGDSKEEQENAIPVVFAQSEEAIWTFTEDEVKQLQTMIEEEEARDTLNDLLFITFILFKEPSKNEDLKHALVFLRRKLKEALTQADFSFAFRLVSGLRQIRQGFKNQNTWAMDDMDQFFKEISSAETLNALQENIESLDVLPLEKLKHFSQFFRLLNPDAIFALGPLLGKTVSARRQLEIHQIIAEMAAKDLHPLESLLKSPDEVMVAKLISVVGQFQDDRSTKILLGMLRHSSDRVRMQAASQLPTTNSNEIKQLFRLVEDPDASIRDLVFKKLGKKRSQITEELFLDYLQKGQFTISDHQHFLACYGVLGKCGSDRSIEFLQGVIFNGTWVPYFGAIHCHGAMVALKNLGTPESDAILKKASRSLSPRVRRAYGKALKGKS